MARQKLKEEDKRKFNKENLQKLYGIFRYLLPYKTTFILGLVCLIIGSFLLIAFPYMTGKLVDVAAGGEWYLSDINSIAIGLVLLLFFQSVLSFFRVYLFALVSENGMADIRSGLYERLVHLPMAFYDRNRTGELMSRISSDVTLLQSTFSTTLAEVIRQIVTLIGGVAIIIFTTPKLSLFMLASFPLLVIIAMVFGKKIKTLSRKSQDSLAQSSTIVEETLQSIQAVKAFTNEWYEKRRYKKAMNEVVDLSIKTAKFRALFISFIIFALFGGLVAVMWYGAALLQSGEMSVGELISFVLYTTWIGGSIAGLGDLFGQIQRAIGASERILEIHTEDAEVVEEKDVKSKIKGQITFERVTFAYPSRREIDVLSDLSLTIHPGEKVAVVGKSGAGKSTIAQLILRLYSDYQGSIQVDEADLKSYALSDYRKNIGVVPQEIILFGGSIRENIAYGKPDATMDEIKAAAAQANALDFIESFPEGFGTLVGERGIKLSGGQRQRIAIARTILKDPSILILDEATSALDAESESEVQDALNHLMKQRTTIIIAHRLATIKEVDKILVLENGQIKEAGSHEELMGQPDSAYSQMVNLQLVG